MSFHHFIGTLGRRMGCESSRAVFSPVRVTRYKQCSRHRFMPLSTNAVAEDDQETSLNGLYRLLSAEERNLLLEQRNLTEASRQLAAEVGGVDQILRSSSFLEELQLDSTFLVVIAGEFNAGKSTLINALLGKRLLETGPLPTTAVITVVSAKENDAVPSNNTKTTPLGLAMHSVADQPLLEDLTLVDSPGTNSTWIDHTERTLKLLPSADLILVVCTAERPFSESERNLLQKIQAYRKNIVVVINKMDVLDTSGGDHGREQKQSVIDFVTDKASELLGARPVVIPVSSRDALSAKLMTKTTATINNNDDTTPPSEMSNVYQRSNFSTLETFLKKSLTTEAKLKSKLSSPIGVVEGVMTECLQTLKDEKDALQEDISTLNIFQSQFEGWKKELAADLASSRNDMVELMRREGQRCDAMINRIQSNPLNFVNLTVFDTAKLEEEWEHTKHAASSRRHNESLKVDLMELVHETAEAIATRGRAQGQAAIEYLGKRPALKNRSLVGSVTAASRFEDTRKNLEDKLTTVVENILKHDDDVALDKARLFTSLQQIGIAFSTLQVGALCSGLCTYFQLLDPATGWIGLLAFAGGGGVTYVLGTSRTTREFQQTWNQRAERLESALAIISDKELDRVNRRILDGVAPYTRYVESEQQRIDYLQEQCERIGSAGRILRNRISKL